MWPRPRVPRSAFLLGIEAAGGAHLAPSEAPPPAPCLLPPVSCPLPPGGERRLVLRGPSFTSTGDSVPYHVFLAGGGEDSREVTHDGAELVLDSDGAVLADVSPGCRLLAKQPGKLVVRARYMERTSNAVSAAHFNRLKCC